MVPASSAKYRPGRAAAQASAPRVRAGYVRERRAQLLRRNPRPSNHQIRTHTNRRERMAASRASQRVLTDDHSKAAIGSPCEVLYEPTADPRIVMPRWKISASSAKGWNFDDHEAGKY